MHSLISIGPRPGAVWAFALAAALALNGCSRSDATPRAAARADDTSAGPSMGDDGGAGEQDAAAATDEEQPRGTTRGGSGGGSGGDRDGCANGCDDNDPCTRDMQLERRGDCDEQCAHVEITRPRDGDRCCPPGADAAEDSDCDASCGNGKVDPAEACDGGEMCRADCTLLFQDGLVHRYAFDGSGRVATDSVGDADGVVVGTPLSDAGELVLQGGASGGYVDLPDGIVSALTDVTVEAWVSWLGGAVRQRIFDFGMHTRGEDNPPGDGTSFFMLETESSDGRLAAYVNFSNAADDPEQDRFVEGRGPFPTGAMHHVAVTFDSGTDALSLYLDGEMVGSRAGVTGELSQIDDRNVWIGRANFDEALFRGTIHEFRIYDRALDAAAIQQSERAGPDPALE
jgi:hypothetical protein